MGHDKISSRLIKELKFELIEPLQKIMKKIIKDETFPDIWKKAKVIPLYKKGDPKDAGNYRPISLLPALSKVAEKVIANQIYKYLETTNQFPPTQYGFRRGKSTGQAISNLVYELEFLNLKKHRYALIMIDFSKAFDLIDHNILAQKLGKLGFDDQATRLITSYLNNRVQFVSCNNKNSKDKTLDPVGCPQGSILGPLMYLIYTIDIKNLLAEHFHIMYADDTGLIVRLKKNEGTGKIRDLMQRILNHFTLNKLKMNVTKTVIMGKGIEGEIAVEGTNMNISKKSGGEKYLGVKINPELNWAGHFEELVRKVKFGLHALSKIKKVNNVQVKKSVYEAFIKSHINYAIAAWYPTLTKRQKTILEQLNKAAIRMIAGAKRLAHTANLYKHLGILNVEDQFIQSVIAGGRKLRENINKNNNLHIYTQIIEPKTRTVAKLIPKQVGGTLYLHTKIMNEHKQYINSTNLTPTVLANFKKNKLQGYNTDCRRRGCPSCVPLE